jgi:hypothetical protein
LNNICYSGELERIREFLGFLSRIRFSVAIPFIDLIILCLQKNIEEWKTKKKKNVPKNLKDEKVKCCPHLIGFLITFKSN